MQLQVHGKNLLIVEMVETQNMMRDMDIGGLSRLTEMELIIWMMMHQLMVQDKREILVTMQGKGIPGGQLLSVCASMGIRFLGENHQTRTSWMGRLKVARNKEEGLAKTSKSMLIRPRSANMIHEITGLR